MLQAPRAVFSALRDDSPEAASARQEPVTAIVFLAGVVTALAAARSSSLLDDRDFDAVLVAVWALAAGGVQGLFGYWLIGGALYAGLSAVGPPGSYRRARHLLGYALVPLLLALIVVWPLRLAVGGGDVFREGGGDDGPAFVALALAEAGLYLWVVGLLLLGVRVVTGSTWARSLAAGGVAAFVFAASAVLFALVL